MVRILGIRGRRLLGCFRQVASCFCRHSQLIITTGIIIIVMLARLGISTEIMSLWDIPYPLSSVS